ncbi:dnaJ homolog subfamily C member 4 [Mantella aurantiaca]
MMSWRAFCKGGIQICMLHAHRFVGTYSRSVLQDHYQVLGVGRGASSVEIKNAFFTLSKKCHPDSDPSNPLLHAQFVRLNEAYNVLSKSNSRKEYDQILDAIQRHGPTYGGQNPYKSASRTHSSTYSYRKKEEPFTWSASSNDNWYWSQFRPQSDYDASPNERQFRNEDIVMGCILLIIASIFLHYFFFSALKEIRNKELEEQQKKIWDFYNKTKETARINGFTKQKEILIQRHEERIKKLYGLEDEPKK